MGPSKLAAATLLLALCATPRLRAQEPTHPLDDLSSTEYWTLRQTLKADSRVDEDAEFLYAGLNEPPKADVVAWRPGTPFSRQAKVHFVQDYTGYEAVVDLKAKRVLDLREVTKRQYMDSDADGIGTRDLMEHPAMVAAFEARGITDLSTVRCSVGSDAYFDTPEERGRRLGRARCTNRAGRVSGLGSPIANLVAIVDQQTGDVLRVIDDGPIEGTPPSVGEHHPEAVGGTRAPLPPMFVMQPEGPGYELRGHQVSWEGWRFHFRVDQRRGIVLSRIGHEEDGEFRSVLYQASLSELFVPYQDPQEPWSHQAYFDLGTYPASFGGVASSMEPGTDCPEYAQFFDMWVVQSDGSPRERQRVACLFERLPGEPAWRHIRDGGVVESRARRDLVLRMVMGAGNYDYLFDWVFRQDGTLRVNLAATGIDQMKAVAAENATADIDGSDGRYGSFVAPHLVAVNHTHMFNFRLDFDIDGSANDLIVDRLVTERLGSDNPRRSVWRVQSDVAKREQDAMRTASLTAPEQWRVVNPARIGPTGHPSGYILEGHGIMSLLSPDDYLQGRAGFTEHTLWATPMDPGELFAAGDYPTNSEAGAGLPAWTASNRGIENTDIVLWYTIGFHHVARPEDWPILPLEMHGFNLVPSGFFDRNPALDLPH
jgi:primary-amine oxidase